MLPCGDATDRLLVLTMEICLCLFVLSNQIIALLNSDSEEDEPSPPFRSDASSSLNAAGWQAADAPGASPFQVSHCFGVTRGRQLVGTVGLSTIFPREFPLCFPKYTVLG